MASSGTINGNQSGTQPYLRISWSVLSQDIPNNRSRVRLQLILVSPYSLFFSASKTGSNNGSSFTYTGGFSGTGTRTLNTREIWVNHNSDGTRTQSVNGSFNIQVTWGGSNLSSLSVSGSMNLDTIPRASEVTAFSTGSSLQISTSNSVNVRLNVYSDSFRFDVALRYGSKTIASWNNQNFSHNTSRSLSLSTTQVNNLLAAMRTVTSGTVTVRVQTKSGSGGSNIGSVQTRNATASIHSNVTPTATGFSVSIDGNGRDSTINRYVQNISRASASFNATARGGTYLVSNRIYIRRTNGSNSSTIHGDSGRSALLTISGEYEAVAETVDGRGRSATQRVTFSVLSYSEPAITAFSATRNSSTPTVVDIVRNGTHSLGTLNPTQVVVQRRTGSGSWTEVSGAGLSDYTEGSFGATRTSTGNSVTQSYEFRLLVTDSFGNDAEATSSVSTQRVVFDIHKNEGVGVGKIHERGVLDVDGQIFTNGDMRIEGNTVMDGDLDLGTGNNGRLEIHREGNPLRFRSPSDNGYAFLSWHNESGTRRGYLGVPSNSASNFIFANENGGAIDLRGTGILHNGTEMVAGGSNSNGEWYIFSNGIRFAIRRWTISSSVSNATVDLPISFPNQMSVSVAHNNNDSWAMQNMGMFNFGRENNNTLRARRDGTPNSGLNWNTQIIITVTGW